MASSLPVRRSLECTDPVHSYRIPVSTFIIIIFLVVVAGLIGLLVFTCHRASKRANAHPHWNHRIESVSSTPRRKPRHSRSSMPLVGFKHVWHGRSHGRSASVLSVINISPSNPAIFGQEKEGQGAFHVTLTPPTPAKVVSNHRNSIASFESAIVAARPSSSLSVH